MSEENVELVKAIIRESQRDWKWALSMMAPDVRLDQSRFPDGGVYKGPDAFGDFYRRWFGTWDELTVRPDRFIDDGDRVVALMTLEARGKGSGTPVTMQVASVWGLRDGKVVEVVGYPDQREALEELGL
jgi:ketosteroid isomerase-like protein